MIRAVLWDFGGVILASPFEAFTRYERRTGLPLDFIRSVNATEPARQRVGASRAQRRSAATSSTPRSPTSPSGSAIGSPAPTCSALLSGEVRPEMVVALDRVKRGRLHDGVPHEQRRRRRAARRTSPTSWPGSTTSSSRARSACASPSRAFYEIACELLAVDTAASACSSTTSASTSSRPRRWA